MEKPSESATGELTTGSDEETTRTTTVNVCNGARCRCLEALPVVVKHVNNLPSKKAEVNSSVVPVKKRTDSEESDSPVTKTSVPGSSKPEYVQDEAGNAQLASVPEEPSVESEDGTTPSKFNEESGESLDEPALGADAAPPPEESPPPSCLTLHEGRIGCSRGEDAIDALGSHTGCVEDPDDVLNYVCFVKDGGAKKEKRKPDLREVENRPKPEVSPNVDREDFVPEGKRVICSVEGFEATSVGFIDSLPAELLIDTGAIGSLVDSRVLASSAWRRPHCDRTMAV
ncbi:hypothetical protein PF010_g18638 [Phytophthora fragariae]|uniref:Peptidase A2 domain-containing protein n=1 Tax=Phytophthora fragariae TaxID=53985 RepID=A0A6G0KKG3_9STRA|nr:hypothetical protein PF010_g18638 [Phytophthora fragariae]